MSLKNCLLAGMFLLLGAGANARAQVSQSATAGTAKASPSLQTVPRVSGSAGYFRKFNVGLNYAGVHNSAIGWYSVASPALSYTFSDRYSADVSSSIYFLHKELHYIPREQPTYQLVKEGENVGDTLFAFHTSFQPGSYQDVITATLSAPTGNVNAGLGTGRVTFDVTNHVERYRGPVGLFLDVGSGDSSTLFNTRVSRNYSTLGALAHFLTGMDYWIGDRAFVESLAYEQLPLGSQKLYTVQGKSSRTPPQPAVMGSGVAEDNGLMTYVGIPAGSYLTFGGYYNRSLRRHSDTVSLGFTFVLRGKNRGADSLVDRALREAEQPNP